MKQKVILITGASSGIGRDAALALAARGRVTAPAVSPACLCCCMERFPPAGGTR